MDAEPGIDLQHACKLLNMSESTLRRRIRKNAPDGLKQVPGSRPIRITEESFNEARRLFAREVELALPSNERDVLPSRGTSDRSLEIRFAELDTKYEQLSHDVSTCRKAIRLLNNSFVAALDTFDEDDQT